ncbi:UBP-type zinc finger domain-containing protein [Streptomyces arboris]|uniref:UBP-type zinc finger domain-containing protein n=1 Tax=Streptomyces arboris TaxID=2600619 RepID=UPI003636C158
MTEERDRDIDVTVGPSGPGCEECLAGEGPGWWVHLRRCAACGHVGCCDSSPSQHASGHAEASGHPVLTSFEPGEDWFYDVRTGAFLDGPALAAPTAHPASQPVPGPAGAVPEGWRELVR